MNKHLPRTCTRLEISIVLSPARFWARTFLPCRDLSVASVRLSK
jgi:hypothetical protein